MTSFPHSAGTARPYVWAPDRPRPIGTSARTGECSPTAARPTAGSARSRNCVRKDSSPHRTSTTRRKRRSSSSKVISCSPSETRRSRPDPAATSTCRPRSATASASNPKPAVSTTCSPRPDSSRTSSPTASPPPGLDAPTGNERRAAMEAIAYLQAPSPLGRPGELLALVIGRCPWRRSSDMPFGAVLGLC